MWQIGELAKEVQEQCSDATYSHRINHPGTTAACRATGQTPLCPEVMLAEALIVPNHDMLCWSSTSGISYLTPPVDGLQMGVTSASSHTVAMMRCCLLRWPLCWHASFRASSSLCGSLWQVRPIPK